MPDDEERPLGYAAIQNAQSILLARQRAEQEMVRAKEALERKTEEVAHSLAMMRATLESTWDGILVTDDRGQVTHSNRRYAEMWRLPADVMESLDHQRILEHLSAQFHDRRQFLARVEEVYAASPDDSFDVLELADGRVFERFSRTQVIAGRNVGRVWSFRDITDSRRAEEALREETRLLEILNGTGITLSSTLDLPVVVRALTDAAVELSGADVGAFFSWDTSDDLVLRRAAGTRADRVTPGGTLWAMAQVGAAVRATDTVRADDARADARLRAIIDAEERVTGSASVRSYLAVPVITRAGEVVGRLCLGHPETGAFSERAERMVVGLAAQAGIAIDNARLYEGVQHMAEERRHLLDSERFARSEAERANAMKDDFLATLSHELRTPLNAILGWAHMLRFRNMSRGQIDEGLEVIERNARVQTQLIDDLLDMSRITSGKMRLDIQSVEPASFVEAAIETVTPAAEAKGIRLVKLLDPAAGPIACDPNRLQQVVWNLLSNAIKFTGRNGRVQVLLERVDSHIEVTVADTGIGIAPDFLAHVFDRFRQADGSRTRSAQGLGLGLAIVKHLVELHGGTVRVASPGEGGGTTFTVRLPLTVVRRDAMDGERVHPNAGPGNGGDFNRSDLSAIKVLVVDDQPDARALIQRVLEECDAVVLTASTAGEALALVEQERPHVLVSDIGMPDTDGYELLRRVRALGRARGGGLPAVALTAFARSEDRTRALRAGFLVHVAKPVEPSELVATVASVVGRTGDTPIE